MYQAGDIIYRKHCTYMLLIAVYDHFSAFACLPWTSTCSTAQVLPCSRATTLLSSAWASSARFSIVHCAQKPNFVASFNQRL